MGQWRIWQSAAIIDIPDGNILEMGHGTGQLLLRLVQMDRYVIGIDPSRQMTTIAARRLERSGFHPRVIQAKGQSIPLPHKRFSVIISTFPSAFIFDPKTLQEAYRVLIPGGRFIIVGSVRITGRGLHDRFAAWLFKITGQAGEISEAWDRPLLDHGFKAHLEQIDQRRATILRVVATKD
jgi:ubiquinone/menaquinone biosynthesis C-methylase UbiE